MDKAKAAVGNFLSKDGKHDTTVHETINPAVQQEHVTRTQLNQETKAVDREVHQDHYHTSVQPIADREVLPEQHSHQLAGVEHRHLKHGSDDHAKSRLTAEQAQFKNTREVGETQRTTAAGETVAGEHVHHHVHENIQPVIQKETVQHSVVHTTVPVHEIHQNEAKHHTASQLPPVTMGEFKSQGGSLGGREERTDAFGGEPRSVGGTLGGAGAKGTTSLTDTDTSRTGATGTRGSSANTHSGVSTTGLTGNHSHDGTSAGGYGSSTGNYGSTTHGQDSTTGNYGSSTTRGHDSSTSTTGKKPSLLDRLNPKKDTDGDGKSGIMD
ncbi:hypothetical protein LHYA1_G003410 [Lachnellula hyalina]|uniref:Allergen n=1 Tax=Lachnellula hyalina TaxID=1316788 RepID=A0A8H8U1Q7_9HELO|nr:uncharacterized protein LHYA1_G003410 [Lachnellula hyalina]TVY27281.1 hypothetical protein LHYA1_G003410 [Lachnellula hyalina]